MKKKLITLTLSLLSLLPALGQIGESRSAIAIGFNAGVSMNTVGFDPTIKQDLLITPSFGATFRVTSEKYFNTLCALQLEVNYAKLGWKEHVMNSQSIDLPNETYQRELSYIQVPAFARLAWGYEKKGAMFYILAGPQLGFCFNEQSKKGGEWKLNNEGHPDRPNNMYVQYDMEIDRKVDYGIAGGAGIEINTKIGHFMLDGRYYYGLADIFDNGKKDVFSRSNNGTIAVRFTYLFDIRK